MWFTLLSLVAAAAAIVYWFIAAEAREAARGYADAVCKRAQVQLLDGGVVLRRLRLRHGADGLQIERRYSFEFSPDGVARARGWLDLLGDELRSATVPFIAPAAAGPTQIT